METVITMLMIHDPKGNAISLPSTTEHIVTNVYRQIAGSLCYNTKYIQRANLICCTIATYYKKPLCMTLKLMFHVVSTGTRENEYQTFFVHE